MKLFLVVALAVACSARPDIGLIYKNNGGYSSNVPNNAYIPPPPSHGSLPVSNVGGSSYSGQSSSYNGQYQVPGSSSYHSSSSHGHGQGQGHGSAVTYQGAGSFQVPGATPFHIPTPNFHIPTVQGGQVTTHYKNQYTDGSNFRIGTNEGYTHTNYHHYSGPAEAPTYGHNTRIIAPQQQQEEKTKIFVLVKKPEEVQDIHLPAPEPAKPSKPEVFFVKYDNQQEAEEKIRATLNGARGAAEQATNLGSEGGLINSIARSGSQHQVQVTVDKYINDAAEAQFNSEGGSTSTVHHDHHVNHVPSTVHHEEVHHVPSTVHHEEVHHVSHVPSTVHREEVHHVPSTVHHEEVHHVSHEPSTVYREEVHHINHVPSTVHREEVHHVSHEVPSTEVHVSQLPTNSYHEEVHHVSHNVPSTVYHNEEEIHLPAQQPAKPSKPDVFIVNYNNQQDAEDKIRATINNQNDDVQVHQANNLDQSSFLKSFTKNNDQHQIQVTVDKYVNDNAEAQFNSESVPSTSSSDAQSSSSFSASSSSSSSSGGNVLPLVSRINLGAEEESSNNDVEINSGINSKTFLSSLINPRDTRSDSIVQHSEEKHVEHSK